MADGLEVLTDKEIKLECLRLAVEFAGEYTRIDPLLKAQQYYDWVMNERNSLRKSIKTSKNKDQV